MDILRDILSCNVDDFRRALHGDPPARVEPMKISLKPGAHTVKAHLRRYDLTKSMWLAGCMAALPGSGLVLFLQVV